MPSEPDHELIRRAWELKAKGQKIEQIAEAIEMGKEQTRRYLRVSWLEAKRLGHLRFPGRPMSNIERTAHRQCQMKDHSWMTKDRFLDHGFSIEKIAWTNPTTNNGSYTFGSREDKVCLFCGHVEQGYPQLAVVV